MGEELALEGFPTLRMDYDGTGESMGHDREGGRVASWIESVQEAIDALRARLGVQSVGVIGLRMGAILAVAAAARRRVDTLVLWEPCASGSAYAREMEIVASATQKALTGRSDPRTAGAAIEAAGYMLTAQTIADLGGLRLDRLEVLGTPDVLLIRRDDRPAAALAGHFERQGCPTTEVSMPGYKEMMVYPLESKPPRQILDRIRTWAAERASDVPPRDASSPGAVRSGAGVAALLDPTTFANGVSHRARRFGPNARLFGVSSEAGAAERVPILLLAGGVVPRTAVNRMYFDLAGRLAASGHRVLRFDVSGIGESDPAAGAPMNEVYPAVMGEDVRAGVDLVTCGERTRPVWLIGLCSGAYGAFQHALSDERVAGITLINPLDYYPQGRLASTRLAGVLSRIPWHRRRLRRDIGKLVDRGVGIDIAFSDGDPGREVLLGALGGALPWLQRRGVGLQVYEQADHTFNPTGARRRLLDWIVDGIDRRTDGITQGAS